MRQKRHAEKLLEQAAGRVAVCSHAPLFKHHVALLVELAHHGVKKPLGFKIGPELDAVGRERIEVGGLVRIREGVQSDAALPLHDLAEFFLHHVFVGGGNRVLPGLLELGHFLVIAPDFPPTLPVVGVVGLLDVFERHLFIGIIARPDLVGALEGHVLEHVSQAGDPGVFAVGAHVHVSEERENRRFVPLANQHRQPVVQDLDRHAFFERGDVLRARRGSAQC